MRKGKRKNKQKGTLAGARTRSLNQTKSCAQAMSIIGPAACLIFEGKT